MKYKPGQHPNSRGNVKGMHWRIKDTSKMNKAQIGVSKPPLSKEHRENIGKAQLGKYVASRYTKERNEKIARAMTGEKNPSWKGGNIASYRKKRKETMETNPRPGECEVCGALGVGKIGIVFDHNHETGEFRGWICSRCNLILGHAKDNSELLISLAKYLNK